MGLLAAGQVVVLPFPFSDLSRKKYRPVLALADACRGGRVACQINSNSYADPRADIEGRRLEDEMRKNFRVLGYEL